MAEKRPIEQPDSASDEESDLIEIPIQSSTSSIGSDKAHRPTPINVNNSTSSSAKYKVSYKVAWASSYPIRAVSNDPHKFHCIPCSKNVSCGHQGLGDVKIHCGRAGHIINVKKQKTLFSTVKDMSHDANVLKAEVLVTNFLVQHDLPLATADHLGPLFKELFPDSKIAKPYASGRTKTTAILNEVPAPECHEYIVGQCKGNAYSVGTDGSNDTGVSKMNPVTIRIFDVNRSKTVTNHFFDMCLTEGEHSATARTIFSVIEHRFAQNMMLWNNCVALSIDNTNAMTGRNNSIASRFRDKNPQIFVGGCPCHLAHIAASHANDYFSDRLGLNVENICIDCYYWFDKSSKRKGKLLEYFEFCDQEYQSILKHLSVRWLSLERCLSRILKKYPSLKSYFLSEHFADERFQRLLNSFANPMLEPALLFHAAAMPLFTSFNLLLQRDEPTIHILKASMESLGRKLANRIVQPQFMKDVQSVTELDLDDEAIFRNTRDIFLGGTTKFTLNRLLNEGEISDVEYTKFTDAAQSFFKYSLKYIKEKFPLDNKVIDNAVWVDVECRANVKWGHIECFLENFSSTTVVQAMKLSEAETPAESKMPSVTSEQPLENSRRKADHDLLISSCSIHAL